MTLSDYQVAYELLKELTEAVGGAFISSWQGTHEWQKQLDAAREFINEREQ